MGKRGHPSIIPAIVVRSIGIIIVLFTVPIPWGLRDIVGAAVHGDFQAPSRDDDDQKFCPLNKISVVFLMGLVAFIPFPFECHFPSEYM